MMQPNILIYLHVDTWDPNNTSDLVAPIPADLSAT